MVGPGFGTFARYRPADPFVTSEGSDVIPDYKGIFVFSQSFF